MATAAKLSSDRISVARLVHAAGRCSKSSCRSSCDSRKSSGAADAGRRLDDQRGQPPAAAAAAPHPAAVGRHQRQSQRTRSSPCVRPNWRAAAGPAATRVLRRAGGVLQVPHDYGRGGTIGPDLSNLIHRDYASVLRDITHPSFAINPDHLSYTVTLNDGRMLDGVVHTCRRHGADRRREGRDTTEVKQGRDRGDASRRRSRRCPRSCRSSSARSGCATC